jgi:hypothetical protein
MVTVWMNLGRAPPPGASHDRAGLRTTPRPAQQACLQRCVDHGARRMNELWDTGNLVHLNVAMMRQSVPSSLYTGLPSTTLTIDAVGVIEVNLKPAPSKRAPYSSPVRSTPPGNVSIAIS